MLLKPELNYILTFEQHQLLQIALLVWALWRANFLSLLNGLILFAFFGMIVQYRMLQILEVVTCRKQESSLHLKCSLRSFHAEARLPAEEHVTLQNSAETQENLHRLRIHPFCVLFICNQCLSMILFLKYSSVSGYFSIKGVVFILLPLLIPVTSPSYCSAGLHTTCISYITEGNNVN